MKSNIHITIDEQTHKAICNIVGARNFSKWVETCAQEQIRTYMNLRENKKTWDCPHCNHTVDRFMIYCPVCQKDMKMPITW